MLLPLLLIVLLAGAQLAELSTHMARIHGRGVALHGVGGETLQQAERVLARAVDDVLSDPAVPFAGCAQGRCANGAGPDAANYDWLTPGVQQPVALGADWAAAYWLEWLGDLQAGESFDCVAPVLRCRYWRLVAGAVRIGPDVRRTLETIYRIDSFPDGSQAVRLSWRRADRP